jgi:hypothetical protein
MLCVSIVAGENKIQIEDFLNRCKAKKITPEISRYLSGLQHQNQQIDIDRRSDPPFQGCLYSYLLDYYHFFLARVVLCCLRKADHSRLSARRYPM